MFLFKKRTGTLKPTDNSGRRFLWTIPEFTKVKHGTTLDSENVMCFTKVKFHFHMVLNESGDVGLYIHYKAPPIPKYSYHFTNAKNEVMRQHTAHTIPAETERCGHWNVCNHNDMVSFLGDDDTLYVRFVFDDDTITIKRISEENLTSVLWTVPSLHTQYLNPFTSQGFQIDKALLVVRLDVRRGGIAAYNPWNHKDVSEYIFFLFCRKGDVPAHTIELLDGNGTTFMKSEKKEDGTSQTLMVERAKLDKHLSADKTLFVKVDFSTGGNPLEALNLLGANGATNGNAAGGERKTAPVGEKKVLYDVMDD